jgi:hypothetical protein
MVSITECTRGWGVFMLGARSTVMRYFAFDAVERFPTVGLGKTIFLAASALYYVVFDARCFNPYFSVLQIFEFVDFFVVCCRF